MLYIDQCEPHFRNSNDCFSLEMPVPSQGHYGFPVVD